MDISNPIFNDETKAREYLEGVRWPNGPFCPHCGEAENIRRLKGKSHRPGLHQCNSCRQHFTVTVGTVYERSKIPLHKWLLATHLMSASKKGVSAHQLHRMLGVTYKTAWFMAHRIREAMREPADSGALGGPGVTVEADETFIGRKKGVEKARGGFRHKHIVMALVERDGRVRSIHVDKLTRKDVSVIVRQNISRESRLMTDEAKHYRKVGREFAGHGRIHHTLNQYVSMADPTIHTNTVEGYFSIFKRGMKGIYQHCAEKHLHRYLAEFDFMPARSTIRSAP